MWRGRCPVFGQQRLSTSICVFKEKSWNTSSEWYDSLIFKLPTMTTRNSQSFFSWVLVICVKWLLFHYFSYEDTYIWVHVVWCGFKYKYLKDKCLKRDWIAYSTRITHSKCNIQHNWEDLKFFTLIMIKILIWATKITRGAKAITSIWIC